MNEAIHFEPWEGERYGRTNELGLPQRLLVLGESNYGARERPELDRPGITTEEVKEVFDPSCPYRYRLFTSLFKASCGEERDATHHSELEKFCHAIAFYNFVQEMMPARGDRPTAEQWKRAADPFFECLDKLKPSHVVACGFGLWDGLPTKGFSGLSGETAQDIWGLLPEQGKRPSDRPNPGDWIGRYKHAGGSCLILRIKHPSVAFKAARWRPVFRRFFKLKVD